MTDFIEWSDGLSVGVKLFDSQHKKLIEVLNALFSAMREGKGRDIVGDVLQELQQYTEYHFGSEEKAFKQYGFHGAETHIWEHRAFVEKVNEFIARFKKGEVTVTFEIFTFLKEWLIKHIRGSDSSYRDFFQGKNITV
ncbi:MAG: hemerythrin [Spirochaetaceae bacterium]|nr:MAG: hemerythrin [Spirochaetaceae bacterium]